jgi:hypothetical protein
MKLWLRRLVEAGLFIRPSYSWAGKVHVDPLAKT